MNIEPSRQLRKSELRQRMRRRRAAIEPQLRQQWDTAIGGHLLDFFRQQRPEVVAGFIAFDGEPDLAAALEQLARQGARPALPVIREAPGRAGICFRQWSPKSEMKPNRYGIPEPVGTLDVPLSDIDLVLIPLVAWDKTGGRLGMGASYYDRAFQPFAELDRPLRLGIAYRLQEVERIPLDPWDIRLHGVLTENGYRDCRPPRSSAAAEAEDQQTRKQ